MSKIDVKFMKANRSLAKQMGSTYTDNKKKSGKAKSTKKK